MPPGGRRRGTVSSPILLLFTFLFLFTGHVAAQSAVLGIDVGTSYLKAALVKPGVPLDIVLTKDSKRKEAAAIALKQPTSAGTSDTAVLPERIYGSDALAIASRFPADVYPNLKPLLGSLTDTEDAAAQYAQRFPGAKLVKSATADGPMLGFEGSNSKSDDSPYSVEELLAMQLSSIKANAEAAAGKGFLIRDAVITVPPFYTVDERRAVELAAELADLRVMGLLSDGLAVGLNYATSRTFPNIDKGEKPEVHLVYDMGAGSASATVVKFQSRSVKEPGKVNKTVQEVNVVGTGWDKTLGGDALNWVLVQDMVKQFTESKEAKAQNIQSGTVLGNGRAMAKLWREAERLRQILSANSATNGFFESFYDDVDFRYKITRTDFESAAASVLERVGAPMQTALQVAGLQPSDIDSIVMHGGAVRTPAVQKQLEVLAGDAAKLRSNVNADESAAFGAAFKAAGLSPSFRVKDIDTHDTANYPITMQWDVRGKPRKQTLFVPTSQVGVVKQMPVNTTEDITFSFSQAVTNPKNPETPEQRQINSIKMTNMSASHKELQSTWGCTPEEIKTIFSIRLDPVTNLPEIKDASVSCEVDPAKKKAGTFDGMKNILGFGGKKDQEPLVESESSSSASAETSPSGSSSSASASASGKAQKKQTKVIPIAMTVSRTDSKVLPSAKLAEIKDRIVAFETSDNARKERSNLFNALESFTYKARDLLEDEGILAVSTPQQREAATADVAAASDWIHAAGPKAGLEEVREKLENLKGLVNPMQKRKAEQVKRPKALKELQGTLTQSENMLKVVKGEVAKYESELSSWLESSSSSSAAAAASSPAANADDEEQEGNEDEDGGSSSAKGTPTSSSVQPSFTSTFSQYDLLRLESLYNTTTSWLSDTEAEQKKLVASDDPVLLSSDLRSKADELSEMLVNLVQKQQQYKSRASSSKTSKTSKSSKSKSTKTSSSTTPEAETPTFEAEETPSASSKGHEEL